jgi:hypothetical protein
MVGRLSRAPARSPARSRGYLLGVSVLLALVLPDLALAAFATPKLTILSKTLRPGQTGELTIRTEQSKDDDAPFRLTIYVPRGYTAAIASAQDGAQIGTVTALVQANAISPDAIIEPRGLIRIDMTFTETEYPLAPVCLTETGVTSPVAVLRLELSQAGTALPVVPVYVALITDGPEAVFASAKLITCLPSPYIPVSAGGATQLAKLIRTDLTFPSLFISPSSAGGYRWRSIWTPYMVGTPLPNVMGTIETQAVDSIPPKARQIRLRAGTYNKRTKRLIVEGSVTEGGKGVAGTVQIFENNRRVATARSAASGAFSTTLRIARKGTYMFRASATVAARETSGCTAAFPPMPCLRSTAGGFTATSANVRVRIR